MKYKSNKEKIWVPKEGKPGVRKKKGETPPKKEKVLPKVKLNPYQSYYGMYVPPQLSYVREEHKFAVGDKVFCIKAPPLGNNIWNFNTLSKNKIYTVLSLTHYGAKGFVSVSEHPDAINDGYYYQQTHSQDIFKKYENV